MVLMLYSTTDGQTLKICQRLKGVIEAEGGHQVVLVSLDDELPAEPGSFDKIVIGASIRYGKHSKQVYDFIRCHENLLDSKPNAFFTVNVVARKPEKSMPETNPYMLRFLSQITWKPKLLAVFAGRLDYPKYGFFDRQVIRLIMWITHGPTRPDSVVEFTDWDQVEAFGKTVREL